MLKKLFLPLSVLAVSVLSALVIGSVNAEGTNLIPNPSVETVAGTVPANWNQGKWGTNSTTFTYKTTEGNTGTHSLYVNMTSRSSGDAKWYFTHLSVKPSQKYTYTEFYKSNVATELDTEYLSTTNQYSHGYLTAVTANSASWKSVSTTFTTPANVKTMTIFHLINRVGWLQTDDFSLVEAGTTPAPTAPTVNITAPAANSTIAGMQNITANASDSVSVAGVQFKVDGANLGAEDTAAPYSASWDTKTVANGNHTVTATARNTSGLTATATETVNVQNPVAPTVSFTNPAAGSTISGMQGVAATASSDTAGVQFKLDGNNLGAEDTTAPYSINWDTTTAANGSHTLTATARSAAGLTTTATETVNVQNVVTPPPVSTNMILNPSVETSANGTSPDNWLSSNWGTNTSTFSYLNTGHTGNRSLKVETNAYTNGAANWYYNGVAVTAGKAYKYENWYQSNVDTEVDAQVTMSDGTTQFYWLGVALASNSWSKFSTSFTPPVGAKSLAIYQILAKNGYIISDDYFLGENVSQGFSRALVSVTLDDGWTSQYQNALPILNKYGLKATFYIISGELTDQPDYMSAAQVKGLYAQGMEIGSHTITHSDLTQVSQTQLVQEMSQSQTTLQNAIGAPVTNFAYPYGAYNSNTIAVGKQYYRSQRSVNAGYNSKDDFDITQLKIYEVDSNISNAQVQGWIQGAITQKAWLILVYHEIGANIGGDIYNATTANFDNQMSYLKNTGVAVVTVNQALNEVVPQL